MSCHDNSDIREGCPRYQIRFSILLFFRMTKTVFGVTKKGRFDWWINNPHYGEPPVRKQTESTERNAFRG